MSPTTGEEMPEGPVHWPQLVLHHMMGLHNDSVDHSRPQLRPSLARVYPLFVLLYGALVAAGTASNAGVVWAVGRARLHRDATCGYLLNAALADLVKSLVVLPVSLTVLLVQNWVFGGSLCYFLPMLQDIPMHVTMLSFVLIAADRHRYTMDPSRPRMPAFVCCMGTWLLAVCIVLPYPIYTTYLDLGTYLKDHFEGVGICAMNLADDMQEYMRGLFIIMYVLPLAVISYLYARSSRELKVQEGPAAIMMYEARTRHVRSRSSASADCSEDNNGSFSASGERCGNFDLYEAELDVSKEKRTQKYLISMVTVYAICLCPLMVLRVAKLALIETYENSAHFDITFITFVWIAFLPTCTTPYLFASWRMSRLQKERLRGYLRFSNRRPAAAPGAGPGVAEGGKALGNVAFIRHSRAAAPGGGADLTSS